MDTASNVTGFPLPLPLADDESQLSRFRIVTSRGLYRLNADRAEVEAGCLSFLKDGLVIDAYAPGRWLEFHCEFDAFAGEER